VEVIVFARHALLAAALSLVCSSTFGAPRPDAEANKDVTDLLTKVQQKSGVPAIAGAIVTSQGLAAVGVTGVRKRGTEVPATLNDKWHLGSNTKAMTATLVGRLIEQDRLKWDSKLADVFLKKDSEIHADLRGVTVVQLLSHRSGLPANLNLSKYLGASGRQERRRAVLQELAVPPQSEPGSKFEYSNLGYIIVGGMVERLTGKTWEENMVEHVFGPLKMESVGFGGTGTPGKTDQPWGHMADGSPAPLNGPAIDNPPVMGPAGRVHCTIQDWARYAADYLRGLRDEPALLKSASYKTLSTPTFGGDYALGWVVTRRDWGGGDVLVHNGSNTMNYATVWIAPRRDFAVLICCNQGGDGASKATDAAAAALIGYYSRMAEKQGRPGG
jgi:CubicO group peptidase (beta-lactamase class C family)